MIREEKRGQQTLKNLLYEHGFGYALLAQEVGNSETFLYLLKTRLKYCAVQKLQFDINSSPKASYYNHFKSMLEPKR